MLEKFEILYLCVFELIFHDHKRSKDPLIVDLVKLYNCLMNHDSNGAQ